MDLTQKRSQTQGHCTLEASSKEEVFCELEKLCHFTDYIQVISKVYMHIIHVIIIMVLTNVNTRSASISYLDRTMERRVLTQSVMTWKQELKLRQGSRVAEKLFTRNCKRFRYRISV